LRDCAVKRMERSVYDTEFHANTDLPACFLQLQNQG